MWKYFLGDFYLLVFFSFFKEFLEFLVDSKFCGYFIYFYRFVLVFIRILFFFIQIRGQLDFFIFCVVGGVGVVVVCLGIVKFRFFDFFWDVIKIFYGQLCQKKNYEEKENVLICIEGWGRVCCEGLF